MLGKHPSKETIRKMSESKKGKPTWMKGRHHTDETKKKLSEATKRQWEDPEAVKKITAGWHKKTRLEQQINTLLQQLFPNEFAYNGCFECGITIDRLIPDFPNVNGQKKVIEAFGSFNYKKGAKRFQHTEQEIIEKTARYAKYGYASLFIWDYELKNDRKGVVQKIVDFVGKPPHDSFEGFR
jgi:very-short-patch-repair endonuclease